MRRKPKAAVTSDEQSICSLAPRLPPNIAGADICSRFGRTRGSKSGGEASGGDTDSEPDERGHRGSEVSPKPRQNDEGLPDDRLEPGDQPLFGNRGPAEVAAADIEPLGPRDFQQGPEVPQQRDKTEIDF